MKPLLLETAGELAGLHRDQGPIRVIALHGWMDNAHSFVPLAEQLDGIELVALDLPGHGLSPARPEGLRYHFDDYVFDLLRAADALGWAQFHLLGHSLGGAIASVAAAACPERVSSLALIEGLGPMAAPVDQTAANWRRAIAANQVRPRRKHYSQARAIAARVRNSDLEDAQATCLAERGLVEVEGGWIWRHDQRLGWPSSHRYSEAQVLDLLRSIEAVVLNIYSDPPSGILPARVLERRLAALRQGRLYGHPGGHHLHMKHPAVIGPVIREFFHAQS